MQFVDIKNDIDVVPENVDDEGLKAAYHDANKHSWTKEELEAYDYAAMREQDERGKIEKAEKKGEEKNEIKTIMKLYNKHKTPEDISDLLDISIEEVNAIILKELNK